VVIPIPTLKPLLKKLGCVKSDVIVLDTKLGILAAKETSLAVYIKEESFIDPKGEVMFFPAQKFSSIINKLSGSITLHTTENGYSLLSNRTRVELQKPTYTWKFNIPENYSPLAPTSVIKELISFAQIAYDPKQTMTYSGLVSLKLDVDFFDNGYIEAVSTDGKRIAMSRDGVDWSSKFSLLLPASLGAVFPHLTGDIVHFADSEQSTAIRSGNIVAVAAKYTAKFPDISKMVSHASGKKVGFDAAELSAALDRVQPMLDNEKPWIKLTFGNSIVIETVGGAGSARDEVECSGAVPEPIYFEHKFLADFISKSNGNVSYVGLSDPQRAVLINGNKTYVLAGMAWSK
jgi:DNA polymerase III sliding clamp (beta) subunit (PCNA family)